MRPEWKKGDPPKSDFYLTWPGPRKLYYHKGAWYGTSKLRYQPEFWADLVDVKLVGPEGQTVTLSLLLETC